MMSNEPIDTTSLLPSGNNAQHTTEGHIKIEPEDIKLEPDIKLEEDSQPSHSSSNIKRESFRCGVCGEYFFYEQYFYEHIREHHLHSAISPQTAEPEAVAGSSSGNTALESEVISTGGYYMNNNKKV